MAENLVRCQICGWCWDSRDPAVRFVYGDGRWECADETACFDRVSAARGERLPS